MSICVLCSRTFGSDQALRQHEEDSPKHGTFDCKACKRSFSSQDALTQHQDDSPIHQRSRRDSVTASATPVPFTQYVPLLSSTSSNVPSATHDGQRSRDTATENSSHANPIFDSDFIPLEDTLQALTISDINTTTARAKTGPVRIPRILQKEFTFPELHQRIAEAVAPAITSTWFNHNTEAPFEHEYGTNIVGTFKCVNNRCKKKGWSSGVVATWIYGYSRNGYNAIVYNQRCKACDCLGSLKMDEETYVERVAYRLKKWAGVKMERPFFGHKILHGPHDSERCEGCKVGHCTQADDLLE
ncbi:hypothetical protein AA0114_g10647 [Alternaria tenuissima]|uniref:C2H2-type domain-containing protein n=1 Tax=Alternaria tenuissima TaxID=119927 RepID=A0A4Q4M3Q4_9PLEO|nr:hypothetical protein AA0114_g10647 [Alternaria tenuissima]